MISSPKMGSSNEVDQTPSSMKINVKAFPNPFSDRVSSALSQVFQEEDHSSIQYDGTKS
jgi:hypothetical protein